MIAILISVILMAYSVTGITGGINTVSVHGKSQIDGIISGNDQLEFVATANIEGDSDLSNNLMLTDLNGAYEQEVGLFSCAVANTGSICSIKFPSENNAQFNKRELRFAIYLYDDSPARVRLDKKDIEIIVDNTAPVIGRFGIGNTQDIRGGKYSKDGKVKLLFDVADEGFNGDRTACAGVKSVEFYILGSKVEECNGDCIGTSQCQSITGRVKDYTYDGTGEVRICAKAIDRLDRVSGEKCSSVILDKDAPKLLKETKKITGHDDNKPLTSIATGRTVKARISVDIEAVDIDEKSLTADISELNSEKQELKAMPPTSIIADKDNNAKMTLIWDFELKLIEEGTKKIYITASDILGNSIDKAVDGALEFAFAKDDDGPVIKAIKTSKPAEDGGFYTSERENFIAELEDASGVNKDGIILHIGSKSFSARECKGDKSIVCEFDAVLSGLQEGKQSAFIDKDSKDVLGNTVKDRVEITAIIDTKSPSISDKDITISGIESESSGEYIKHGDKLKIVLNARDMNPVTVSADIISIILNAKSEDIPCVKGVDIKSIISLPSDTWVCQKETNAIDISGEVSRIISFTVTDLAGNKVELKKGISVNPVETQPMDGKALFDIAVLGDYIGHIDYSAITTMARKDYSVIVPFMLNKNSNCNSDAEIINPKLKCSGLSDNAVSLTRQDTDYFGYVDFRISKDTIGNKEMLSIGEDNSCVVEYTIKCGNVIYKTPENQKLSVNIYVDKSSVDNTKGVEHDIETIKDEVNDGLDKLVDTADKLLTTAQNACNIKQGFASALKAINILGGFFAGCKDSGVVDALSGGFCNDAEGVATKIHQATSKLSDLLSYKWIDAMCGYASCTSSKAIVPGGEFKPNEPSPVGYFSGQQCEIFKDKLIEEDNRYMNTLRLGQSPDSKYTPYVRASVPSTLELSKKNLFIAAGCGCLPGIIHNIQKNRQIKCRKGVCLRDVVATGASTPEGCNREYSIDRCKYLVGQSGVGIALDIMATPIKLAGSVISHPVASAYVYFRQNLEEGCTKNCPQGTCTAKWTGTCVVAGLMVAYENAAQFADVLYSIDDLKKTSYVPDFCEILNNEPSTENKEEDNQDIPKLEDNPSEQRQR